MVRVVQQAQSYLPASLLVQVEARTIGREVVPGPSDWCILVRSAGGMRDLLVAVAVNVPMVPHTVSKLRKHWVQCSIARAT